MIVDKNFNPIRGRMSKAERKEYAIKMREQDELNAAKDNRTVKIEARKFEEKVKKEREMLGLKGR